MAQQQIGFFEFLPDLKEIIKLIQLTGIVDRPWFAAGAPAIRQVIRRAIRNRVHESVADQRDEYRKAFDLV